MSKELFITYGGERLPYRVTVDPTRQTRIAIHVEPNGEVIVDAPFDASSLDVQRAVHHRARWVFDQVTRAKKRFRHVRAKEYVSGEEVLYLGRRYMLKVEVDAEKLPVKLIGKRLVVHSSAANRDVVRGKVWAWYRIKGREYFDRRLEAWAQRLPWVRVRPSFRLMEMEKRWGSCTPQGEIILNPHLIKAPRDCIDYVLLHELAHLRFHDHSQDFWQLIETHKPDWRAAKAKLDESVEWLFLR